MITGLVGALPVYEAGKARFLAVTNSQRAANFPDVPTVKELGQPIMSVDGLAGFFGGRDMSNELRDRIGADIRALAGEPELKSRLEAIGQTLLVGTPAEFAAAIERQRAWATEIAKLVNFRATQ